jgi:nitrile hydratase
MLIGLEGLGAGPGGRAVREEMEPADYLAASYYERWLYSAEQRLLRKGTIAPGEVEAMMARLEAGEEAAEYADPAMTERVVRELRSVHPMAAAPAQARFAVGEPVRVRRMHPPGHTRCPRYARGATGLIEALRGADRLPDVAVYGERIDREAVYSVAFTSTELWGAGREPPWTVLLDLWESYLEPA